MTEGHCPRLRTLTRPSIPPAHLQDPAYVTGKITAGRLGPCKRGLVPKTIYSDPASQLKVCDRSVSATEGKADPTRDIRRSPHQGL